VFNDKISRVHKLPTQYLVDLSTSTYKSNVILSLLSTSIGLQQYNFMGLSGMHIVNTNPIKIFDGIQVHSFEINKMNANSIERPFLAVLTRNAIHILEGEMVADYSSAFRQYSIAGTLCNVDAQPK